MVLEHVLESLVGLVPRDGLKPSRGLIEHHPRPLHRPRLLAARPVDLSEGSLGDLGCLFLLGKHRVEKDVESGVFGLLEAHEDVPLVEENDGHVEHV